jgi:hypothetical protein
MTGMGGAAPQDMGLASGLINTTYQVGSALGTRGDGVAGGLDGRRS